VNRTLSILTTSLSPSQVEEHASHSSYIFVVADGMGGHRGGEFASALSVATVQQVMLDLLNRQAEAQAADDLGPLFDLKTALHQADARVAKAGDQQPDLRGMGTTLTLAAVCDQTLTVFHAGNCRCYLLRGGRLWQVTKDHTLATYLADRGSITHEEVARSPLRRSLTNSLGAGESGLQVEVTRTSLTAGDVMLLCSDGLTLMLPDELIATVLASEPDPHSACRKLVDEALQAGGKDNVTVIVTQFGG
jgi:protein phosphatase